MPMDILSYHISLEQIDDSLPWDWSRISVRRDLNITFIKKHANKMSFDRISRYTKLTIDELRTNIDLPWNWSILSGNIEISIDDKLMSLDLPWVLDQM